jgi:hypothetical protein
MRQIAEYAAVGELFAVECGYSSLEERNENTPGPMGPRVFRMDG